MAIRSLAFAAIALLSTSAAGKAADLVIPTTPQPIMESAGFSWAGLYLGVQGGGQFYTGASYGLLGVHVGVNFLVAEPVLLGLEGTAEWIFNDSGSYGEVFANARLGVLLTDPVLLYAIAGTGIEVNSAGTGFGTYQLGGGVEFAVTDSVSVRAQLVGVGFYNDTDMFDGAKATIGVSFHF